MAGYFLSVGIFHVQNCRIHNSYISFITSNYNTIENQELGTGCHEGLEHNLYSGTSQLEDPSFAWSAYSVPEVVSPLQIENHLHEQCFPGSPCHWTIQHVVWPTRSHICPCTRSLCRPWRNSHIWLALQVDTQCQQVYLLKHTYQYRENLTRNMNTLKKPLPSRVVI